MASPKYATEYTLKTQTKDAHRSRMKPGNTGWPPRTIK